MEILTFQMYKFSSPSAKGVTILCSVLQLETVPRTEKNKSNLALFLGHLLLIDLWSVKKLHVLVQIHLNFYL